MDVQPGAKIGFFVGEGALPVQAVQNALNQGWDVYVYAMDKGNLAAFKKLLATGRLHFIHPGLVQKNFDLVHQHGVRHAVFVGKVNKWTVLTRPVFDSRAWGLWHEVQSEQRNDDSVMLAVVREFDKEAVQVLRQTDFLQELFIQPGLYSRRPPSESEKQDIEMGLNLAKEMGRLDIGQTVVVSNLMAIAIEAIEGTDQAILRSKKWIGKKGGVVVKVEKPNQDLRFDVPTVGPRTLRALKKAGLKVLAVEAGKTLVLDLPQMTALADQLDLTVIAV